MKLILLVLFFYLFFRFFFYIAAVVMGLVLTALGISAVKNANSQGGAQNAQAGRNRQTGSSWFGDRFRKKPKVYKYPGREAFCEQDIAEAEFEEVN